MAIIKYFNFYFLFIVFFILLLMSGCCNSNKKNFFQPKFQQKVITSTTHDNQMKSVIGFPALNKDNKITSINCTGFFISQKLIVTAAHCLYNRDMFMLKTLFIQDKIIKELIAEEFIKHELHKEEKINFITKKNFFSKNQIVSKAKLIYLNRNYLLYELPIPSDIAILEVIDKKDYSKNWLKLADREPYLDEDVYYIGMPSSFFWLLISGKMAGYDYNSNGGVISLVVNLPLISGASGSPLMNFKGEVVGLNVATPLKSIFKDKEKNIFQSLPLGFATTLRHMKIHIGNIRIK